MRRTEEYWVKYDETNGAVSLCFDIVDAAKSAIIFVLVIFVFGLRAVGVEGSSMYPTLHDGDWVAVRSVTMNPKRGDIVVVTQPWERNVPIIKRVIAVGGDEVYIDFNAHEVYVNGERLNEEYIAEPTSLYYDIRFPLVVDEGKLFVMGDNRNDSLDSRSSSIGLVDERYVFGKAEFRISPSGDWKIYSDSEG